MDDLEKTNVIPFEQTITGLEKYIALAREMYETRKAALEIGLKVQQIAEGYNQKFSAETADLQIEQQKLQAKTEKLLSDMVEIEHEAAGLPKKVVDPKNVA